MTLTFEISKQNSNQIIAHIWLSVCIDFQEDPAVLDFFNEFFKLMNIQYGRRDLDC